MTHVSGGMKPNNVDAALTAKHDPDLWDDYDEPTEPTTASTLLRGHRADEHFADAHEAGRALRERRRTAPEPEPEPETTARDWSNVDAADDFDYDGAEQKILAGEPVDYYDFLEVIKLKTKGRRKKAPTLDSDEWRAIPGFENYLMHPRTRRVWRQGYERTLPSGAVRKYPAKEVTSRNGTFTLSADGVPASRGVNSLYRLTFPEVGKQKRKKRKGEWDDTVTGRSLPDDWTGTAEWVQSGGVGITTRPK